MSELGQDAPDDAEEFTMDRPADQGQRVTPERKAGMLAGLAALSAVGIGGTRPAEAAPQKVTPQTEHRINYKSPENPFAGKYELGDHSLPPTEAPSQQKQSFSDNGGFNLDALAGSFEKQQEESGKLAEGIRVLPNAGEAVKTILASKPEGTILVLFPSESDQLHVAGGENNHFSNGVSVGGQVEKYLSSSPAGRKEMPDVERKIVARFDGASLDTAVEFFVAAAKYRMIAIPRQGGEGYTAWIRQERDTEKGKFVTLKPTTAPEPGRIEEAMSADPDLVIIHYVDPNSEKRNMQLEPDKNKGARRTVGIDFRAGREVDPEDVSGIGSYIKVGKGLPAEAQEREVAQGQ
ncbi:MAG TPA: hypothetical protein PK263_03940 [bacterium]|nr:hypothetical protein [bacterium]